MAVAFRCDRCDKLYDYNKYCYYNGLKLTRICPQYTNERDINFNVTKGRQLTLCPECMNELETFMNKNHEVFKTI